MNYASALAALREKTNRDPKAREALHAQELTEKVLPVVVDKELTDDNIIHFEDVEEGAAHVVVTTPTSGQYSKFRHTLHKDSRDRGVVEAKAKAGAELAAQCIVYPDREAYAKLCESYPAVSDAVAKKCIHLAEAGAAELGKG